MCHSQDHIHGHMQDVHNHVLENKSCVQDHILHKCPREHRHQPLAQPQLHAFHIRKFHSQGHIHGHNQDVHNHVLENKCCVQDHILHKCHREHWHQPLAQPQLHVFHIHNIHDHSHGHSREKSSQDFHNHKHGVQDHILHKNHREHPPQLLAQHQHHAFHIHNIHDHIHGHIQEKSSQDVLHHSQDDDQHSHTEGQHQQQPELLCK